MRITGGDLARRTFEGPPKTASGVRPTTDRVREALFSALGSRVDLRGARVVDLFCGTGALALEALSRGASRAVLVEKHGGTLRLAKRNASELGLVQRCTFLRADALSHLRRAPLAPEADLIFADPPYALDELAALPALALPHVAAGGLFVLEHDGRHDFSDHPACVFTRDYGSTRLTFFEAPEA